MKQALVLVGSVSKTVASVLSFLILLLFSDPSHAQVFKDNFEGDGTISAWVGDNCGVDASFANPFQGGENTSERVLQYSDEGGQYANIRFDIPNTFDFSTNSTFSLKIYVSSSSLTGEAPNQVSLKLQDGTQESPWMTQTEIIKPIVLDEWQTVTFNFAADSYINLDPTSLPPIQRTDFNRVLIQVNGEDNNDQVVAYIDDFYHDSDEAMDEHNYNRLVWADEFDAPGAIDSEKWFAQTQLPAGGSWFNGEIQHYTDRVENAYVEDGIMYLTAKRETFTDQGYTKQFTSARLNSKFAFTYGRVVVRAKLPTGVGTWPAIWMLGKNITEAGAYWQTQGYGTTGWPACGEIDIMEHWGNNQNYVQSATHTPSSFGATINHGGQVIPTASTEFHEYELIWSPEQLRFSVDGTLHYVYEPADQNAATWPFTEDQYLLLNIAIQPSIAASFTEDAMEIDYVRVYQEGDPVSTEEVAAAIDPTYFPNPVDDEVTVVLPEQAADTITFNVYQLDGKLLKTIQKDGLTDQITINGLGDLPEGIYILNFRTPKQEYSLRLIKN